MLPLPFAFVNSAFIASAQARELCDDIEQARLECRMTRAAMASYMKLGEPPHGEKRLSDQLTLKHPLNIYRLADLPPVWWQKFLVLRAKRAGLQIIEDAQLATLIHKLDRIRTRPIKAHLSDAERQVG